MSWTEERVSALKTMFADGYSASRIAGALGGITRNAVIGKLHRMGLSGGGVPPSYSSKLKVRKKYTRKKRQEKIAIPKQTKPNWRQSFSFGDAPPSPVEQITLTTVETTLIADTLDLEAHHCRWIPGDPGTGYCGCKAIEGLPYCETHARRAYAPATVARPYNDVAQIKGLIKHDVLALQNIADLTSA